MGEAQDVQPERATVPKFDPAAITAWTYLVIITQTHVTDERVLRKVLGTLAAYVGMIGSRRRVRTIFGDPGRNRAGALRRDRSAAGLGPGGNGRG